MRSRRRGAACLMRVRPAASLCRRSEGRSAGTLPGSAGGARGRHRRTSPSRRCAARVCWGRSLGGKYGTKHSDREMASDPSEEDGNDRDDEEQSDLDMSSDGDDHQGLFSDSDSGTKTTSRNKSHACSGSWRRSSPDRTRATSLGAVCVLRFPATTGLCCAGFAHGLAHALDACRGSLWKLYDFPENYVFTEQRKGPAYKPRIICVRPTKHPSPSCGSCSIRK
ncbi:uncharacterized protein SRS1_17016 [Sporisorium reilianum f. sp. reilianum]|uniref:Uncharacterized protein n=1 Tax=Sporisorium reilianum f. sp. reilianum TaxID=72559 RepID=A0A2N8UHY9_9BASI|nr:uncharacterized protein SRS1_17016 [Sporisorium reilianum f. sp. reilianum]